jgi:HD-like signal output (HDOD) protein/CheY-like chemotaxis protein
MSQITRHVLFVDDEANVLSGLKRMLRSLRHEWTMEFVDGGEAALAYMDEHVIDVIVSDMRMPGMDGATLLKEVATRHPGAVRIALSGQSDQETLMKVAGIAHQYLSKPCDTDTLKSTVQRALTLRQHFGDESLKSLVAGMNSIPSLPTNYQEIMRELKTPDPSLAVIGEIIARDVAMTAKVLQLVNSAFFGIARRVTCPEQAVKLLGLQTVNGLVLSAGVFSQFDSEQLAPFSVDGLIEHSLQVASKAKRIASRESGDTAVVNDAFVAGVLHDVGKLVLAANYPQRYSQAISAAQEWNQPLSLIEREMFGAGHADVGGFLLELWGLPTALIEAVAFHHDPGKSQAIGFTALTAVHVANALVHGGGATDVTRPECQVDAEYLASAGVPDLLSNNSLTNAGLPAGAL